jgi:hypothetical protein
MAVMTHNPAVTTAGSITEAGEQALRRGEHLLAALRAALTKLNLAMDQAERLEHGQLLLREARTVPADGDPEQEARTMYQGEVADATALVLTLLCGEGGA